LLCVLALCGLRLGEALGLQWTDVDMIGGTLTVRRQVVEVGGVTTVAEPKTKRSRRTIPLPKLAADAIKRRETAAKKEGHKSEYIFVTITGRHPARSNLRRDALAPNLLAAKVPTVTFHGLRGSVATVLAQRGVDIATIGGVLGQAQPSVTLQRYLHVSDDSQRRAIDTLDSALRAKPRKKKA
jgi:integrase